MLAHSLARHTLGALVNKDVIRAALFSPEDLEYSTRQDDFVMEIMLEAARYLLQRDPARKIFLDGRTFSRRYQIDRVIKFADDLAQPLDSASQPTQPTRRITGTSRSIWK